MTDTTASEAMAFLHELDGWESAYPLSIFPEPDLKKAAELLKAGGMTLDTVSASNMRHVVSFIATKARAAIAALSAIDSENRQYGRGFYAAMDSICHFINSLDSSDMTPREVRSAIYGHALAARPALSPPPAEGEKL